MEPADRLRPLGAAVAVALATLLLHHLEPVLAVVFAAAATVAVQRGRCRPGGLAALPTLLACMPPPPTLAAPLPPGPVRVAGIAVELRHDPALGERAVLLDTGGGRIWLHVADDLAILPGDRVAAIARSSPPAVPGDRGSLRAAPEACAVTPGTFCLPRLCAQLRSLLQHRLACLVPGPNAAVLATLVLGNGTRLPGDVAAAHRATGLSHLLAVSGAHAAMLAWILGLQPFGGGRRRPVGRAHLLAAMLLLFVYGAITGFEPPVFRALCSYALVATGLRLGRRVRAAQGLAWPALLSAVVAPAGCLGPSFSLSYAAVLGLALAGGPRDHSRLETWLLAPIRASSWATATTAPLTLFWFGQLAPWTILLTPLLAPLVAALLLGGLGAAIATALLPQLTPALGPPLRALTQVYVDGVLAADALPATPIFAWSTPSLPLLVAAAVAAGAVLAWRRTRRRALLACALLCLPHFAPTPDQAPGLTLFAVGHGQACVATFGDGESLCIDCGSMQHALLPARKVAQHLRRRCVDLLVLTHGDRDHTGSVGELVRMLPVTRAILPAELRDSAVAAALLAAGTSITFLAPGARANPRPDVAVAAPDPVDGSENDRSLWVRIDLDGTRILATGDAEAAGVRAAIAADIAVAADVLVLPHHGRANAAAEELLTAVAPRLCLSSCACGDGRTALGSLAARRDILAIETGLAGDVRVWPGSALRVEPTAAGGAVVPRR